ncbi:hypothetical protein DFJ67_4020 [Asanoa ferruginea]|uniref:DUF3558 domain-containing protein n=1 Tax=Asanoa ferruginea TaxID=53367 RepID=A0A3D9ZLC7_9ACTN|nr:hypothetical protein [Asanoa ferruginea]REF98011.1 hypothetical protein DFJ67_4020 [Asanoa ferruginea]GIF52884.1 hypothetical protein Afe04nite_74230 [Asanoa ferruginea]
MVLLPSRHSDPALAARPSSVAARLVCLGAAVTLVGAAAGCADDPPPERIRTPVEISYPAAEAGGACVFFDYETIKKTIGAEFDVAAASQSGQTTTCVVQAEQADLPDLTLTISKTSADADVFKSDVVPDKGATAIKGLGLAAYQAPVAAAKDAGAGLEICWLTKDKRLMSLRFTGALDAPAPPKALAGKLVTLAKEVETVKPPKKP